MQRTMIATTIAALLLSFGAHAQNAGTETARDTDQQKRIEQGLKSGQLSTREAASLENQERRVDATEARDMRNGKLSAGEKAQIQREQNHVSADIYKDNHNAVKGNPNSASSQRMQADVQRNVNQDARIHQGVRSGQLTNKEAGSLERGQAHVDRAEAHAGANGRVGAGEQARIQGKENHQSARIYNKKHNDKVRPTTP
ncbi:MAG: hypothetical protein JSS16_15555 [Proteobacteria bacterium]|uniref:hypothetical protein n=1 Tax=Rudaea sp. TaxID=2136325 RepID=UPI001DEECFEC|nr:hypothetical protein [Pseudomonadota bacterium]MBS0568437.1 hypothetical protein [Pseudomonadota bacterium]